MGPNLGLDLVHSHDNVCHSASKQLEGSSSHQAQSQVWAWTEFASPHPTKPLPGVLSGGRDRQPWLGVPPVHDRQRPRSVKILLIPGAPVTVHLKPPA